MWHAPAVARFDAELYLRLAGEEMLLGPADQGRRPWDPPLSEVASALLAVGAISATKAQAVLDDYSLAEALRSEHGSPHHMAMGRASRSPRRKAKALKPRRVVPCDRVIENAQGTMQIRRVVLAEDSTTIALTWRPTTSPRRSRRASSRFMFGSGPMSSLSPALADDRGTAASSNFEGGGSEEEWEGDLTAHPPLAPGTAWIEIDGTRIELTGQPWPCEISIEPLAEAVPAHRYLWRRLSVPTRFHGPPESLEPSIEALIAAGALPPDDPVIDDVRSVLEAMPQHPGMSASSRAVRSLPQPWRSLLLRQGKLDGPEGTITLGALTPVFDGFSAAVMTLESQPEGMAMEVEVTPGIEGHGPFNTSANPRQLAWWAADDRGNHYLGQIGGWSGSDDQMQGEINLWPALHPKARRLQIMPTGDTARAVISVQLPWAPAGSADKDRPK